MPATPRHPIVVIGAGIAGLLAAWRLRQYGHDVIVLEATDRPGGQLRTTDLAELRVDVGAEAVHLGAPHLATLIEELGLTDTIVAANTGTTLIGSGNQLRAMPAGVGPFGPTKLLPVIRSGLLSPKGVLRAGREPLHTKPLLDSGDISVGDFLTRRFGSEVVDAFVAPLLGNLHSGDIRRLSLRATAPQLVPAATRGTSLLRKRPRQGTVGGGAGFASWPDGMCTLTRRFCQDLDVRVNETVRKLTTSRSRWTIHTDDGEYPADALVLATPAKVIAALLDPLAPGVGGPLRAGRLASVASVVARYPAGSLPDSLTAVNGILMTPDSPQLLKAATILTNKWPHVAADGSVVVRMSAGRVGRDTIDRLNDRQLAIHLQEELARLVNLTAEPTTNVVARWSVPQAEVGHQRRIQRVRNGLTLLPPLALAGGAVDGLGLASVVRSAEQAASLIDSAFP